MDRGEYCPETEFRTRSAEGEVVSDMLDRPGIWVRSGMAGVITGMALGEAMAMLPENLDRQLIRRLLVVAEISYVAAAFRRAESEKPDPPRGR